MTRIVVNPNYIYSGSFAFWGDAALLQLATPIASPPIPLATTEIWQPGTGAVFAGWGRTTPGQVGATPILQFAETVVQSSEYCKSQYGTGFHPVGELCTINPPSFSTGTCNGDSGGPLLALRPGTSELLQIGITSFGASACDTTAPNVFTRSDFISTWANNRIIELAPKPPPAPPKPATPKAAAPPATVKPELPRLAVGDAKTFTRVALTEGLNGPKVRVPRRNVRRSDRVCRPCACGRRDRSR